MNWPKNRLIIYAKNAFKIMLITSRQNIMLKTNFEYYAIYFNGSHYIY